MILRAVGLIVAISLGVLLPPLAASAQQPGKVPRVGIVFSGAPVSTMVGANPSNTAMRGLLQGLRDLGYVEGQNIVLERRSAEGKYERLPELMAELIRLNVDLIVAGTDPATAAAKQATRTIPIVAVAVSDPVESGFVASFARPGGNITGLSAFFTELSAKHLELIKEAVPKVSRVAILRYVANPLHASLWREIQISGQRLGVELQSIEVRDASEFESAFSLMTKDRAGALIILPDALFFNEVRRIASLATKHRLPAIFARREFVDAGGLLSYGESTPDMFRRAAVFVDKILKGVKAGDLPFERPMKFELIINLKTAKALGLTVPQSILVRADQVIQ